MPQDLGHLDLVLQMIERKKRAVARCQIEIKALQRCQYLLERT
jgi:hypothetical protein